MRPQDLEDDGVVIKFLVYGLTLVLSVANTVSQVSVFELLSSIVEPSIRDQDTAESNEKYSSSASHRAPSFCVVFTVVPPNHRESEHNH